MMGNKFLREASWYEIHAHVKVHTHAAGITFSGVCLPDMKNGISYLFPVL